MASNEIDMANNSTADNNDHFLENKQTEQMIIENEITDSSKKNITTIEIEEDHSEEMKNFDFSKLFYSQPSQKNKEKKDFSNYAIVEYSALGNKNSGENIEKGENIENSNHIND